jgi:hypothetical protein
LVTGKRYRAHNGRDPGEYDPYGIYYFKWTGENFAKIPIVYGPIPGTKGCGIAFQVVDIDGDGQCELVTGKRYRAHNDNGPGSFDDYGISYFKWNGQSFTKQPIIFGKLRETKGLGIYSQVVDLNGDGRLDILAPGKDGLAVLWNVSEIDRTPKQH